MGDVSFVFKAFPKVIMAFALWLSDEEFPARAVLLYDGNSGCQAALDVVWAMALTACLRLLSFKPQGTR